jgi:putative phage-type endonuclease
VTAPVLLGHFEPGSEEWRLARLLGVGGSEVAMLVGLSPYGSEFSLYHAKTGLYVEELVNDEMEAGTRLEPVIAEKFADMHPEYSLQRPAGTWHHADRRWQIANPDGLLHDVADLDRRKPTALLETKFSLYADQFGEEGTDEIPIWYRCQALWYLDTFGLDLLHLMVFVGSEGRFREYIVRADATDQATLRTAAERFLDRVKRGQRPSIDGHDKTYEVIKALHPEIDPSSVELPPRLAQLFCGTKAAAKAAETEARRATALVADHMGRAQRATFAGQTIASSQARGDGTPYVVAARNLPNFTELEIAS